MVGDQLADLGMHRRQAFDDLPAAVQVFGGRSTVGAGRQSRLDMLIDLGRGREVTGWMAGPAMLLGRLFVLVVSAEGSGLTAQLSFQFLDAGQQLLLDPLTQTGILLFELRDPDIPCICRHG